MHFFHVNLQILKSLEMCAIYSKKIFGVSFSGNLSKQAETALQGWCRTPPQKKKKHTGEQGDPNTANVGAQARSDKEKKPPSRIPTEVVRGRDNSCTWDSIQSNQSNFIWISGDKKWPLTSGLQSNLGFWGKIGSQTPFWLLFEGGFQFGVSAGEGDKKIIEQNTLWLHFQRSFKAPGFLCKGKRLGRWLSWPS